MNPRTEQQPPTNPPCNQPCASLLQATSELHAWEMVFVESFARLDSRLDTIEKMVQTLPEDRAKQLELYEVLLKARGARMLLIGVAVAVAGIVHFTTDITDWIIKYKQ